MRERSAVESFNSAIEGFFYVIKTQKNMRVHFSASVAILLAAIYLNIPMHQILTLCGTISLVLIMEMVNTAVELTVDMVMETFHPLARIVKDITAGAVLLSAVNAFVVGYLVFQKRLGLDLDVGILKIRQSPWHLTFIATILVMALVMLLKVSFHKGKPLRGGMPSGHAAFVFSAWTIIVFLSGNSLIVILTFLMSVLVARSRVANKIHSFLEVIAGAALGVLATTLVFQLLRR